MGGVSTSPILGRLVDKMVPWYGVLISTGGQVVFYAIQTAAAGLNVAVVVVGFVVVVAVVVVVAGGGGGGGGDGGDVVGGRGQSNPGGGIDQG